MNLKCPKCKECNKSEYCDSRIESTCERNCGACEAFTTCDDAVDFLTDDVKRALRANDIPRLMKFISGAGMRKSGYCENVKLFDLARQIAVAASEDLLNGEGANVETATKMLRAFAPLCDLCRLCIFLPAILTGERLESYLRAEELSPDHDIIKIIEKNYSVSDDEDKIKTKEENAERFGKALAALNESEFFGLAKFVKYGDSKWFPPFRYNVFFIDYFLAHGLINLQTILNILAMDMRYSSLNLMATGLKFTLKTVRKAVESYTDDELTT